MALSAKVDWMHVDVTRALRSAEYPPKIPNTQLISQLITQVATKPRLGFTLPHPNKHENLPKHRKPIPSHLINPSSPLNDAYEVNPPSAVRHYLDRANGALKPYNCKSCDSGELEIRETFNVENHNKN